MNAHKITSFYSYKGGVGRSMAVANVAVMLALRGERVLVLDFDLEAPGLHRYFRPWLKVEDGQGGETELVAGVVDFFEELRLRLLARFSSENSYDPTEESTREVCRSIVHETTRKYTGYALSVGRGGGKNIDFLPAGYFDDNFQNRVREFDWVTFFETFPEVFELLRSVWKERYDHILIDSRTGLTDIGSITTMILPDQLAVVFAPNEQSLHGGIEIARQAIEMRQQTSESPLMIFPLVARVDGDDSVQRRDWLSDIGKRWSNFFKLAYGWNELNLLRYFEEVHIPHSSYYAYGEHIAVDEMIDVRGRDTVAGKYASFVRVVDQGSVLKWIANTRPDVDRPYDRAWLVGVDAEIRIPAEFFVEFQVQSPRKFDANLRQMLRSRGDMAKWQDVAKELDEGVRELVRDFRGDLHVYVSAPYPAAILVGRFLNEHLRIAPVHLYQFDSHTHKWMVFSSPTFGSSSANSERWFQEPEIEEQKGRGGPVLWAIEGSQLLAQTTLRELAEQIQATATVRCKPRKSGSLKTFFEARQSTLELRQTLEYIHSSYPMAPIHLVTTAPVAMVVELGRMLSSSVYASFVVHQYDPQSANYFPVLDVMKPFSAFPLHFGESTRGRRTRKKNP
jgi:cellulose biosynthesis protein BcsQ